MTAGGGGLPSVGPFASHDVHFVVIRSPYDISRHLEQGRWGRKEAASTDGAPVLVTAHAIAVVERRDDARELDAGVGTILIGAHIGASASLPLVGAVQVDIELFGSPECVATGDTYFQLRSESAVGTPVEVGLDVEVVRLIENAVERQVERIGVRTWRELKVGGSEYTRSVDIGRRLLEIVVVEELAGSHSEVLQNDTRSDG